MIQEFADRVFGIEKHEFSQISLDLFNFQYRHNPFYKAYTDSLHIHPADVKTIDKIPFLPIGFFKTHSIQTTSFNPEIIFESSGIK